MLDKNIKLAFFRPDFESEVFVPLISQGINAGFPSPAADFEEEKKICDYSDNGEVSSHMVARWYRPPEIILGNQNYDSSIDVWSAGCIIAEIFSL